MSSGDKLLEQLGPVEPIGDAQRKRVVAFVHEQLPIAARNEVLWMLFGPMTPTNWQRTTNKRSTAYQVARRVWLDRVRAWCAEQGYRLSSTQVSPEHQRAYVEATGDTWVPPAVPEGDAP